MNGGWIGVDLDGTLAYYEHWISVDHIGAPVPVMVARVKRWLAEGRVVKIFTARVYGNQRDEALGPIQTWCQEHIGQVLEVTCTKDYGMIELWDDRAVQVVPNTGMRSDRLEE